MKWRRIALWGVLLAVLAGGLAFSLRPQPVPVDLVAADRGRLMVTVDEEGETRVRDVFVLSAPLSGRALRIELESGDEIIADETVVTRIEPIDPAFLDVRSEAEAQAAVETAQAARRLAAAEVDMAKAELDFAQAELDRARRLIRSQTISERALDEAERVFRTERAALETANAGLRMREWELEQARRRLISPSDARQSDEVCDCVDITAPVSGRVLRVLHESEGVVGAGESLIEIGNPRDLEVVVDLLSEDAVKVHPGQRVLLENWGGPEPLEGAVERVEPYGFTKVSALGIEEQRVNVVIGFVHPPESWARLGHGYRVEARILLWDGQDVVKVPLTALFRGSAAGEGENWALFVEIEGEARRRDVTLGHRNGLEAEVTDGLEPGERVVLHPGDRVVEGALLTARN